MCSKKLKVSTSVGWIFSLDLQSSYGPSLNGIVCSTCVFFGRDFEGKGKSQQPGILVTHPLQKWKKAREVMSDHKGLRMSACRDLLCYMCQAWNKYIFCEVECKCFHFRISKCKYKYFFPEMKKYTLYARIHGISKSEVVNIQKFVFGFFNWGFWGFQFPQTQLPKRTLQSKLRSVYGRTDVNVIHCESRLH